jgi:hypothetical protein
VQFLGRCNTAAGKCKVPVEASARPDLGLYPRPKKKHDDGLLFARWALGKTAF